VKRPSKKEIKAAVDKLKDTSSGSSQPVEPNVAKLAPKMSSRRIRKQASNG
jgi:hypothetical protein